jgi:predicted permease
VEILFKIAPLFLVIAVGFAGARKGFFPPGFVGPANRLAYYIAIPALILRAVSHAPLDESLQPLPALLALAGLGLGWAVAVISTHLLPGLNQEPGPYKASWIHCATHGNQGLMGLAIVFYALGQTGLASAGLIITGVIVGQNLLAVITLARWGDSNVNGSSFFRAVGLNPIIIATLIGMALALAGLKMPAFLDRTLEILAGLGVPMALLIVGANLAESRLGGAWSSLASMQAIKLLVIPALGLVMLRIAGVEPTPCAVAVVLLSSPTATLTVILANQMGGDPELCSQAISASHLLSVLSYSFWLWLLIA